MATVTAPRSPLSARVRAMAPGLGVGLWASGAVGLWLLGRRYAWSPGELVLAGGVWLLVLAVVARDAVRNMFGPVFAYEMLRLGRRRLTFVLRGLYVAAATGLLAVMYLTLLEDLGHRGRAGGRNVPPQVLANFAAGFFYSFEVLQFGVVAFLTPAYVAGAIADEKERKTLEFLLATDLQNREIVFGKLAARVATLLGYVLAGLPVLAFLQLFGGIDPDLLLASTAATVVTVVGLSAWSVCLSVLARRAREAIVLTYLSAVLYAALGPVVAVTVQGLSAVPGGLVPQLLQDVTDWAASGNVAYLIGTRSGPNTAWVGDALARYTAWWAVATAGFLAVAVNRLRAVALRQAYGGAGRRRRARTARTRPVIGTDPVFWKEVFVDGAGRRGAVGVLAFVATFGLTFFVPLMIVLSEFGHLVPVLKDFLWSPGYPRPLGERWGRFAEAISVWARVATGILGVVALLAVAVRGAGAVTGERDRDTWVSLLGTPLSSWDILAGKWWGCVLAPRRLYAVLLAVWATGLAVGAVRPVMLPLMVVATAVYLAAFAWLGLLCSVTARTTLAATIRTIVAGVFLGGGFWVVIGCCCVGPVGVVSRGGSGLEDVAMNAAQLLLGCTPPFVMGWMPLDGFDRRDLGPFGWYDYGPLLGPVAPLLGVLAWAVFALGLAWLTWDRFRVLTNRGSVPAPLRPRQRETRRPSA